MDQYTPEIEKGKWMFFIYSSPLPFPVNFLLHTWFVTVNPNGEQNRYEIHMYKNRKQKDCGYLYKNNDEPHVWMHKYFWKKNPKYRGDIILKLSWDGWSLAQKITTFIEDNIDTYVFKNTYRNIPWPNCNTLIQRIVDAFPEIKIRLPWNAIGKNFIKK